MTGSLNKTMLIGNLGSDPEARAIEGLSRGAAGDARLAGRQGPRAAGHEVVLRPYRGEFTALDTAFGEQGGERRCQIPHSCNL